ncbi:MAG: hypothetical protein WA555_09055 [Candidatus Sulfotelmatobacter sp.]
MKSIRKYVYVAALALSALNLAPSQASAQDAAGTFTLTHEVHWQNAIVPAGKYRFTVDASGPWAMLKLRNIGGSGAGLMILVNQTENSQPSDPMDMVVVSRSGGRFVRTMHLPDFGLTLHFAVPDDTREVAQAVATSAASAAR